MTFIVILAAVSVKYPQDTLAAIICRTPPSFNMNVTNFTAVTDPDEPVTCNNPVIAGFSPSRVSAMPEKIITWLPVHLSIYLPFRSFIAKYQTTPTRSPHPVGVVCSGSRIKNAYAKGNNS